MNARQASIYMIIAAGLWGTHPTLIKLSDWNALGTAWARGLSCALLLVIYISVTRSFSFRAFSQQFWCGAFLALNSLLFVTASRYTTAANAVVLMFIFPWITIALDYFSHARKVTIAELGRLIMGVCGITLIVSSDLNSEGLLGNICALAAGVCIALHIFFSQKLQNKFGGNHEVLSSMLLAWIITILVLLPFVFTGKAIEASNLKYLYAFCVLSAIPWLLWGKAVAYIPGHVVAALLSVEVLVAAFVAWLALGESFTILSAGGVLLVLLTATLQLRAS